MKKFMKVMVGLCALMLLFDECHSAGMHKLPRRKSNSERDYGILGNLITAMVDRWYAPPQELKGEGADKVQVAAKPDAAESKPIRKDGKEKAKSQGKASKKSKVKAAAMKVVPVVESGGRDKDYGLLGNLLVYLVDKYNGVDVSTTEATAVEAAGEKEQQKGAADDNEDIDLWDDEESDSEEEKSDASASSSLCTSLSPAERLKHLLEPFVLNLMVDDGGLRSAVDKLRAWEAQERYENLDYIGGGIAAL